MTLTEFLMARIAEDEAYARAADEVHEPGDLPRVLAECEAKRRIVALHDNRYGLGDCASCADGWIDQTSGQDGHSPIPYPCQTLRWLATPYADHPDYDERWRP